MASGPALMQGALYPEPAGAGAPHICRSLRGFWVGACVTGSDHRPSLRARVRPLSHGPQAGSWRDWARRLFAASPTFFPVLGSYSLPELTEDQLWGQAHCHSVALDRHFGGTQALQSRQSNGEGSRSPHGAQGCLPRGVLSEPQLHSATCQQ